MTVSKSCRQWCPEHRGSAPTMVFLLDASALASLDCFRCHLGPSSAAPPGPTPHLTSVSVALGRADALVRMSSGGSQSTEVERGGADLRSWDIATTAARSSRGNHPHQQTARA